MGYEQLPQSLGYWCAEREPGSGDSTNGPATKLNLQCRIPSSQKTGLRASPAPPNLRVGSLKHDPTSQPVICNLRRLVDYSTPGSPGWLIRSIFFCILLA